MIKFQEKNFNMKRKNKHCIEKKGTFKNYSNDVKLIHSNVSNRVILIHSNIRKFFKKQHTSMLYCLANRRSLNDNINTMDREVFF